VVKSGTSVPRIVESESPSSHDATVVVQSTLIRVIDGDTIVVMIDGVVERIRIIGIDTPERGDCGFSEATDALEDLLNSAAVGLITAISDDRDRYGRLLRYLDVAGVDPGLVLIREGLAHAAYDSRSGYERHPREGVYVAADESSDDLCPVG
jgi:endonuclease YncB( thermonuclease family)